MKTKFALSLIAASLLTLTACNKEQAKQPAADAKPAAEAKAEEKKVDAAQSAFKSEEDKQAYSIGASAGNHLRLNLERTKEEGTEISKEMLVKGFIEALDNKAAFKDEEIRKNLMALDQRLREKRDAKAKKDAEEQLAKGKTFLDENKKRKEVKTTESGLQYEVVSTVEGKKPVASDTVKVHYTGTLIDGTEFDSSVSRGEPAKFRLDRVIKGWTEGLQLMPVGSKFKFYIPHELAYGERATGKIPANSTLIFEVELLAIEKAEQKDDHGHAHKHDKKADLANKDKKVKASE